MVFRASYGHENGCFRPGSYSNGYFPMQVPPKHMQRPYRTDIITRNALTDLNVSVNVKYKALANFG